MTEVALTSIAKSTLTLFTSLAKDESILLWNSKKELDRLRATMETIGDLLQDTDKMQSNGDAVLSCLSRLRDVMYDADDLFDSLASKALCKKTMSGGFFTKEVRLFFSNSCQLVTAFNVAHQVKSINESLDQVKRVMDMCGFRVQQPPVMQQVLRFGRAKTHSFVHQEDVIGREQERDRIINMLLPSTEDELRTSHGREFSVVAIIGFGGLGKTTLAQLVYKDERVKKEFDVCLWSCINYLSDLEKVLIEIIASEEVKHNDLSLEKLQEKLRTMIGGKKFLLVIDDLWDENYENWSRLNAILRCGMSHKVLVTTRSTKVAECLDTPKSSYVELEVLSKESAWSLFLKKVLHESEVIDDPELEALGRKIVDRCGNVPLAIIVVGSLLRHRKREIRIWSEFLYNEMGRVISNCGSVKTHKSIANVLMVSYNDLHPNLKLCFAYCSLFPKDYEFDKDYMIRLWISQGFVNLNEDNTQSLEELGEAYFFYLVDRCFFQRLYEYGNFCFYGHRAQMHDLLHDMAIDVAKTNCMFLDEGHINRGKMVSLRHISLQPEIDSSLNYSNLVSNPSIVRTILFRSTNQRKKISHASLDKLFASFRMLRTLSLSSLGIEYIPTSIGELVHLRYLKLSGNCNLRHLPDSICKIHHLMTLDLRYCSMLEKLPLKIGKLISLRHLVVLGCDALESFPSGLAALTSLVNLDQLIVHREIGGLRFLNNLNNLGGVVTIVLPREGWPNAVDDAKRSNMSEKHKLKTLYVSWNRKSVEGNPIQGMSTYEAEAVLDALQPSQNLENLYINYYGGVEFPSWFYTIKSLKALRLMDCKHVEFLEDEMKSNSCFTSLETLNLSGMENLKGWWREEIFEGSQRPCLTKVSYLSISDCPEFRGKMPIFEGIQDLYLTRVDVKLVPELMIGNPKCLSPFNMNKKLEEVVLSNIDGLICLPEEWIRHLSALHKLCIDLCVNLRWVSGRGLTNLTALRYLQLRNCKCEIRDEDEDKTEVEVGMLWKALQRLENLAIPFLDMHIREGMKYLTSLKTLEIGEWEDEEDVELTSKALQNLHTLGIGFNGDKTCDLRKTGVHNLRFLTELSIEGCKKLYLCWKTLLVRMKLVTLKIKNVQSLICVEDMVVEEQSQLRDLKIVSFKDANKWIYDVPWKSLKSLVNLHLATGMGEMEDQLLPDEIQHLSSLQELSIGEGCENVRSIPRWFPQLHSLLGLSIEGCSEELKRRCGRGKGQDWHLICHIYDIEITSSDDLRNENTSQAPVNVPLNNDEEVEGHPTMGWCGLRK